MRQAWCGRLGAVSPAGSWRRAGHDSFAPSLPQPSRPGGCPFAAETVGCVVPLHRCAGLSPLYAEQSLALRGHGQRREHLPTGLRFRRIGEDLDHPTLAAATSAAIRVHPPLVTRRAS